MTVKSPARVAIIGCGNIAVSAHAPALRELAGVLPVGVCDPVEQRRAEVCELLELPPSAAYESHVDLLAEGEPDYVVLTVPQALRRPIIEDCARSGVNVLSEKPIATRPSEGVAFAELLEAAGLHYGMVHNYLYFPEYQQVRQLIRGGEIGAVRHVGLKFMGVPDKPGHADYRPLWRHDRREAGGGILMDMIHVLYLAEHLAGDPIQAVSAIVDNLGFPQGEVEDLALIQLHFGNSYATIHLGWGHGPGGVEVTGSEGRILALYEDFRTGPFDELEQVLMIRPDGRRSYQPRRNHRILNTFLAIHEDFLRTMHDSTEPVAPARAGIRGLMAALAAYGSALTGRLIELPLADNHPLFELGLDGLGQMKAHPASPLLRRRLFGLGAQEGVRP